MSVSWRDTGRGVLGGGRGSESGRFEGLGAGAGDGVGGIVVQRGVREGRVRRGGGSGEMNARFMVLSWLLLLFFLRRVIVAGWGRMRFVPRLVVCAGVVVVCMGWLCGRFGCVCFGKL